MSERIVGTCGLCRGAVCVPEVWSGTHPPVPKCRSCGAAPERPFGPVMPMVRSTKHIKDALEANNDH